MTRAHTTRLGLVASLTILALAVAAPARARPQHGPHGGPPPPGALVEHMADELDLDEETHAAIRSIVEASRERGEALREEIRDETRAMFERMHDDPVDRADLMARVERIGALRTEAEKHRIDTLLAIREQLSPEQREALVEMRGEMRRHHVGPVLDACADDVGSLCEDDGPGAVFCLFRHRDEVSEGCAEALEAMPRHFHAGRGGPEGHGGEECRHHGPHGFGPGGPPFGPEGPPPGIEPLE